VFPVRYEHYSVYFLNKRRDVTVISVLFRYLFTSGEFRINEVCFLTGCGVQISLELSSRETFGNISPTLLLFARSRFIRPVLLCP
jgi:hypothetical protein